MADSRELLTLALAGKYDGIDARLQEIVCKTSTNGLKLEGQFFYLTFRDGQPTLDEFVDFIYFKIVPFCIPRAEREHMRQLYNSTGDEKYIQQLSDKARNLFVRAIQSQATAGEPGELVLFILLEAMLKAPQIACKMYLKTSEQVPVHGSDGIHVRCDPASGDLYLYWGESKVYSQLPQALDSICASVAEFVTTKGQRTPRDRDIDILRDHVAITAPEQRKALLAYFDPYEKKSNQRIEVHACLACFDFSVLSKLSGHDPAAAVSYFQQQFQDRAHSAMQLFASKAKELNIHSLRFHLFLLPFASVRAFREKFFDRLGFNPGTAVQTAKNAKK